MSITSSPAPAVSGMVEMILINEGTIVATGTQSLIIDTGSNVIVNSGTLGATGSGGMIINSDVDNSGLIWADGGDVTISGAVNGSGHILISDDATVELGGATTQSVYFEEVDNAFGVLVIDQPLLFTGQIYGFGGITPSQSDAIDLKGLTFDSGTSWTYYDNLGTDTGGTLAIFQTVDGETANVYSLTFADGEFVTENFILSADSTQDGIWIVDPPATETVMSSEPPPPSFASADPVSSAGLEKALENVADAAAQASTVTASLNTIESPTNSVAAVLQDTEVFSFNSNALTGLITPVQGEPDHIELQAALQPGIDLVQALQQHDVSEIDSYAIDALNGGQAAQSNPQDFHLLHP